VNNPTPSKSSFRGFFYGSAAAALAGIATVGFDLKRHRFTVWVCFDIWSSSARPLASVSQVAVVDYGGSALNARFIRNCRQRVRFQP